jgi:hypothetical protein
MAKYFCVIHCCLGSIKLLNFGYTFIYCLFNAICFICNIKQLAVTKHTRVSNVLLHASAVERHYQGVMMVVDRRNT